MKIVSYIGGVCVLLSLFACASKEVPTAALSSAKMAMMRADGIEDKDLVKKEYQALKEKYQKMQEKVNQEEFEEAKQLSREIELDARLLEKRAQRRRYEEDSHALQGEINSISKTFKEDN